MVERRIEVTIAIDAPASRVWAVLTDFARMPSWNPFIKSITGNLHKGLGFLFSSPHPENPG